MSGSSSPAVAWHVLVPDARDAKILLRVTRDGWSLPTIEPVDARPWWRQPDAIRGCVRDTLQLDATVLRSIEVREPFEPECGLTVFVLEPRQLSWARPSGTDWFGVEDLAELELADDRHAQVVESYFAAEPTVQSPPWMRRGWMASAISWLEGEFDRLDLAAQGRVEQVCVSSHEALLRVPIQGDHVLLKACSESAAHEPELTALLARECPRLLPPYLASDAKRRFLLTRETHPADPLDAQTAEWLIRGLAEVQIHATERPERILEAGCPDDRPELLRARVAPFVDALAKRPANALGASEGLGETELVTLEQYLGDLQDAWAELVEGEVPSALHHPDFGPRCVRVRRGESSVVDWCGTLSHPFFTPTPLIESFADPEIQTRLRELYLEHWTGFAPRDRLAALYARSREVELVYRAMQQQVRIDAACTCAEARVESDRLDRMLRALLERAAGR